MRIRGTYLGLAISVVWVNVLAFSASGADSPAPKVHLVSIPAGGEIMTAKVDSKGAIHLLYDSADGPQYVNSTDHGASWSEALPLVDPASRKPGLEFSVWDMAVGKGGKVHVALGTNAWKLKLPQNEWGLYCASLAPGA